ncbi:MAG TPA: metallophosphoesterase family protein [Candidatus Acidoferrum sp.]|jgi:putative phosphoesterase|nr:metallophosphoesterase family protein [Candidatus Acidoferrum sp.]
MMLGLVSDTHGLLRESALRALQNTGRIIHAGDVGDPKILEALDKVAPVTAVRGNVDTAEWATKLPPTTMVEIGVVRLYVLHNVKELKLNAIPSGVSIIVSGHSHKPGQATRNGVLYINPGSAGPRRFNLPTTVARLDLNLRPWVAEFIDVS